MNRKLILKSPRFGSVSQNEQKTDLKKSQICPIWCPSGPNGGQICHPCLQQPVLLMFTNHHIKRGDVSGPGLHHLSRLSRVSFATRGLQTGPSIFPDGTSIPTCAFRFLSFQFKAIGFRSFWVPCADEDKPGEKFCRISYF